MDAAPTQPGDVLLSLTAPTHPAALPDLYASAEAATCGLTPDEFFNVLLIVGTKHNYNQPPGTIATAAQQEAFFRALHLADLALAQACALGRESAWQRLFTLYRQPLTRAAIAITGNASLGEELADSLYAELYGLRSADDATRKSPLASYTGRGSFLGWLRTTLSQRHIDHHRRTRRESALDDFDAPAPAPTPIPLSAELSRLSGALRTTLQGLSGEDRFLLSSYFLDQRTLAEIGRTLQVHEATISRRLKRLTGDLRHRLLDQLQSGGLSRRAAEEALGADPRDLEINLRHLLQTSESPPFSGRAGPPAANETPQPPGQT